MSLQLIEASKMRVWALSITAFSCLSIIVLLNNDYTLPRVLFMVTSGKEKKFLCFHSNKTQFVIIVSIARCCSFVSGPGQATPYQEAETDSRRFSSC